MSDELSRIKRRKLMELMRRASIPRKIVHLDDSTFSSFVKRYPGIPIILDFWSAWCPPCQLMAPIFESIAEKYRGRAIFAKVDIAKAPMTAVRHKVYVVPTFIVLVDGVPKEVVVGAIGRRLEDYVRKYVGP
ncbi:TPA: thioredoxin [Candidatus Bathyarchaeota archaeon]|nr:thioredoxin [Candidatus Bathyarchaeota archaeon]